MTRLVQITLLSIWALVTYWLFWPYNPLTIYEIRVLNKDKIVQAGDLLHYEVIYQKNTDVVGVLVRKYVDGFKIEMGECVLTAGGPTPEGERASSKAKIKIPGFADASSKARMEFTVTYPVNPFRSEVVTAYSEYFRVTNGE